MLNCNYVSLEQIKPYHSKFTQDIYTQSGILLAKKNTIITSTIIKKLKIYNIKEVLVTYLKSTQTTANKENDAIVQFSQCYTEQTDKIKIEFSDIIDGKDINLNSFEKVSDDIIKVLKYNNEVFDFLSTMKNIDDVTYHHCLNVSIMCRVFGKYLGLSGGETKELSTSALLHDIGKIKIDETLIKKEGPLNNNEYELVKQHALVGYNIIKNQNISEDIKYGVLQHHERYDGTGYPFGLDSKKLNKYAKIISIVDIYDAMSQKRPYRDKMMPLEVLEFLQNNTFTSLDYYLTNKFIEFVSRGFNKSIVKLNTGEEGEIVFINKNNLTKPIIKIDRILVNLSEERGLCIDSIC